MKTRKKNRIVRYHNLRKELRPSEVQPTPCVNKKLALAWELIALVWKTAKPMGLLGIGKWAELQA